MTRTDCTNTEVANAKFLRSHLARHGGDARAAMHAACHLAEMSEFGKSWWVYLAAECAALHAKDVRAGRVRWAVA